MIFLSRKPEQLKPSFVTGYIRDWLYSWLVVGVTKLFATDFDYKKSWKSKNKSQCVFDQRLPESKPSQTQRKICKAVFR